MAGVQHKPQANRLARAERVHRIRGPHGTIEFRSPDPAAIDLEMLVEGETSGRPLDEVLREYGRARSSYYEKLRRFREHGLEGLLHRRPGPQRPWQRRFEVIKEIVRARLLDPDRSAADIARALVQSGHRLSVRSVERTLAEFGLSRHERRW